MQVAGGCITKVQVWRAVTRWREAVSREMGRRPGCKGRCEAVRPDLVTVVRGEEEGVKDDFKIPIWDELETQDHFVRKLAAGDGLEVRIY